MFKKFRDFDYQVSDKGEIKSIDRYVIRKSKLGNEFKYHIKEKILRGKPDKDGYTIVILFKDGKDYTFKVHRMVAELFIPNPNNYPIVNHKDRDVSNNDVHNLEWCTYSYNNSYLGAGHLRGLKTGKPIIAYKDGIEVGRFNTSYEAAEKLNLPSAAMIRNCRRGQTKEYKGYTFSDLKYD